MGRILVICVAMLVMNGCGKSQLDDKPTARVEAPAPGAKAPAAEAKAPTADPKAPTPAPEEANAEEASPAAPVEKGGAPEAPAVPALRVDGPDPLEAADRDLILDARRSTVAFVGRKVTADHEGSFEEFEGTATLKGYTPTNLQLVVQTGSLVADHPDLTNHLKGADFFNAPKYPTARFTSTKVRPGAEGTATHTITGELSLLAVTKRITFPATIVVTDAGATGLAEFKINRKDFGIVYPGRPDDLIADKVLLKLNLAFLDKKYVR